VTILSAGGGCGATTLAINLAHELHLLCTQPSLLIDLDCAYGAAAGYLGIAAKYGIADVLADGDRIDGHLIRSTAVPHTDHLHLLASPATVDFENPLQPAFQHLSRVLQKGKDTYMHCVVDAPRVPMEVAALLSNASVMTYIVLEMTVENIRVARAQFMGLTARGVPADRILPLVSRYRGRREMITMEDAQQAIGCLRLAPLSNDYKGVLSSINYGKLLAETSPRSALRADIQNLAKSARESAKTAPIGSAAANFAGAA
jgi:pilus assembly protein CpaE